VCASLCTRDVYFSFFFSSKRSPIGFREDVSEFSFCRNRVSGYVATAFRGTRPSAVRRKRG